MIRIEWKDYTKAFVEFESFSDFSNHMKEYYIASLPHSSPMEIILQYYDLYIDGVKYEA